MLRFVVSLTVIWAVATFLYFQNDSAEAQPATGTNNATTGENRAKTEPARDTKAEPAKDAKPKKPKPIDWDKTTAPKAATAWLMLVGDKKFEAAYAQGPELLRKTRDLETFTRDMTGFKVSETKSVKWSGGIPVQDGYRLNGEITLGNGTTVPIYLIVLGDSHAEAPHWEVLDVEPTTPFYYRFTDGSYTLLDIFMALVLLAGLGAFFFIIWTYARGLAGTPRELFLLFFIKVMEYSAYGAANMTFILLLHHDMGLSDIAAGSFVGVWSMGITITTMMIGAVCDAIGVKRTLLVGAVALVISRFFMPWLDNIYLVTILGFVPLAIGIAITGPVLKVGIKLFTTRAGATLGFGLFYTLMNVGWAMGAWIFDTVRGTFGDTTITTVPIIGTEMSTYQIIIAVGFVLTLPSFIAIGIMRPGVRMTEEGIKINPLRVQAAEGGLLSRILDVTKKGAKETVTIFSGVLRERVFWIYLFMIGILIFVRLTFYHFQYTFPTYGIRVFGEGVKIGSIFGVLNPVLIIFLVPLLSALTQKVRSYNMLLIGTAISAGSVFLTLIPMSTIMELQNTWFAELIYDRWLEIPMGRRDPFYLLLVIFIVVFSIGEATWSPRLMQFSAEIAPKGREGSYIALAFLPYFLAKFIAGPMSGWLVATYTPEGATSYPHHHMVWVWIGGMAMISPVGLAVFNKIFRRAENNAIAEAEAEAAELRAQKAAAGEAAPE